MATANEITSLMTPLAKKHFLDMCQQKQKELTRRQREYKKMLSTHLRTREETIVEKSLKMAIEQLHQERNDLRAQIYVATGASHLSENHRMLREIQCHVDCQEHLAKDIKKLKADIGNMEREIGRVDRQIYGLNNKTVPDSQFEEHVRHERKLMDILENQLEVGIKRECAYAAVNAQLREELQAMLHHRAFFNDWYTKTIMKLNSDKKYLIDLMEYALNMFENCIDVHEKITMLQKKDKRERDARKVEMQGIMRSIAAAEDNTEFMLQKANQRTLADLQPKEYARREAFRKQHARKIRVYRDVIKRILRYTNSHTVDEVIEKFQQQESLYYSYFSYANEMSFHMTLLNNSVNRLYENVTNLKEYNRSRYSQQLETIESLERTLFGKEKNNEQWDTVRDAHDARLQRLLEGVQTLFVICGANATPLMELLGDHMRVNLVNVRRFLKLLEGRIQDIVAHVYISERADKSKGYDDYVVKEIERIFEYTTGINDIVLTQQCPECAEGEAINNVEDVGDGGPMIFSVNEAKHRLFEKVQQPEMQYRLHSISQCRLPRSRVLAAKRYS